MIYRTTNGQTIQLGQHKLGRGGEGEVLPVVGREGIVAKLYHHPNEERQAKLEFMVSHPIGRPSEQTWVAWPLDILYATHPKPAFAGFIMPRINLVEPIIAFYTLQFRAAKLPHVNYRHLIRCSRNLAATVWRAHSRKCVISDLNETNVRSTADSLVSLIDADSWQLCDSETMRIYRSPFAKRDFLPPELQCRNLGSLDRQPCHDNFSLAVLLYKLLGEGNHPTDGLFFGRGEVPTVEARIVAGTFPFCVQTPIWKTKPNEVPFESFHPRLKDLFIEAFLTGHRQPHLRPSAQAWLQAIVAAESDLRSCRHNPRHWFWGRECTWCQRRELFHGIDPFPIFGSSLPCTITKPKTWARILAAPITVPVSTHGRASGHTVTPIAPTSLKEGLALCVFIIRLIGCALSALIKAASALLADQLKN